MEFHKTPIDNPYKNQIKQVLEEMPNDGSTHDLIEKTLEPRANAFHQGYIAACEAFRMYLLEKAKKEM